MNTTTRKKTVRSESKPQNKGKYASIEAASLAKMESAKDFIANVDMSLFKKNGPLQ